MTVTIGSRLGRYEIVAPLGQGGMGEVFQARDTKLSRDVAIKVISPTFSHDAERVARFDREAQLLAALNHPHIASVYGLEQLAGMHFLVMELVEGETLASRLTGGALPITDVIRLAGQIADALQAAHDKGIIHRDLKPANIALAADGHTKVLDFGLAKAIAPDEGGAHSAANSPTLTVAATQAGVILGTAAYMSPEQAKGRAADKRSDIWAFGAVVYEMLTGRRAFDGEDIADVLAAVLTREPDWSALPPGVPPALRALLRGCLQRERQLRIADIAVVRYVLANSQDADPAKSASSHGVPGLWRVVAVVSTIVAAVLAGTSGYLAMRAPVAAASSWSSGPIRLTIAPPPGTTFYNGDYGVPFAVSPDGRQIAFVATSATGVRHVWVRALETTEARMLPETAGASSPFWSPDNSWIGFLANDRLQKIRAVGGTPQVLAPWTSRLRVGATWSRMTFCFSRPLR